MADYSTYARVVLSNSESISSLIRKYSLAPSETRQASLGITQLALLTLKQIHEALLNPQNSIKPSIAAYAEVVKAHREIIVAQQQAYGELLLIEENLKLLREKYDQADKHQQKELTKAINKLEDLYKNLSTIQLNLAQLETELYNFESRIATLTTECDQDWDTYRQKFLEEVASNIEKGDVPLTDLEKAELLTQDIWIELIRRFKDLGIEIPPYIEVNNPNFKTYFQLKTYLAIHASLSRRMLPHSAEDIKKI